MPISAFPLAIATLIAVYHAAQVLCGNQCFSVDQIQQQGYYPCSPSASTSNCCQAGWVCLSNGLCAGRADVGYHPLLWTGFCTDFLWDNTTACPKICQNNLTGPTYITNYVSSCGDGQFCCSVAENDSSTACCSTSSNKFSLGVATEITTMTRPSSVPITTSPEISATSTTASTPAISSTQPAPITTISEANATSPTASTPATISTQPATSTPKRKTAHVAISVAVGVGVAVGLACLAAGFFYLIRRHLKARREGLREMRAVSNDKSDDRLPELQREGQLGELPADEDPKELIDPRGPRWELKGSTED